MFVLSNYIDELESKEAKNVLRRRCDMSIIVLIAEGRHMVTFCYLIRPCGAKLHLVIQLMPPTCAFSF